MPANDPTTEKRTDSTTDDQEPDDQEPALAVFMTITATGAVVSTVAPDAGAIVMGSAPVLALAFLGAVYAHPAGEPEEVRDA